MIKLIAEIGINHNGDINIAKKLIDLAEISGFDYVKFQKRTPEICVPEEKKSEIKSTPWGEMTYLEYKKKIEFNFMDWGELSNYCRKKEIELFASVWDIESAEFMREFTDIVKIPSALLTDDELLTRCRKDFKTVMMSTGMSTEKEIEHAVLVGDPDIIFHTNSTYPSAPEIVKLDYIRWLIMRYPKKIIGYSGHEFGLSISFAAAGAGAQYVERHITLDRTMWGSDQESSVEPIGMFKFVKGIRDIEKAKSGFCERELDDSENKKRMDLRK
jgi:N-acetylneuraminate synthase